MRILFLTTFLPGARRTGSEVATQGFLDAIRSLGHEVTVMAYRRAGADPPMHSDDVMVADRHIETETAGMRPAAWMARAVLTRRPYSVAKYVSGRYARAVAGRVRQLDPGLVVLDHAQMSWVLPRGGWPVPFVYLAHNIEHRLYSELASMGGLRRLANRREAELIRRAEESLCREARSVWALTPDDAGTLAEMGARASSFDLPASATPAPPPPPAADVAVLGGWHWKANAAGLEWFVREVRPALDDGIAVEVGGASSEQIAGGVEGITVHGRVPDALEFLQGARAIAVPSVAGAGLQIKTLDAIASGRRVVATPTAMRGIVDPPPTVEVAADPAEFARALERAVGAGADDDAARIGREWAERRRERFHDQLREALGG